MDNLNYKSGVAEIKGVGASPGIAIGNAFRFRKEVVRATELKLSDDSEVKREIEKFDAAVNISVRDVKQVIERDSSLNREVVDVLESHLEFITDPQLRSDVVSRITDHKMFAIDSVVKVIELTTVAFNDLDSDYMRARAADVQDIGERILRNLSYSYSGKLEINENSILIAEDISPSDTIALDLSKVMGFATQLGSRTSHTAILARSKNIPAVLGCGEILASVNDGDLLIVDGLNGIVHVNPPAHLLRYYRERKEAHERQADALKSLRHHLAVTADGRQIKLLANISSADDIEDSFEYGAMGAGLFRTEMLFMNRTSFPSEQRQFECYKQVGVKSRGKEVTIRTMDIGGDKPLDYFEIPREDNPFLGYRGVRISLDRRDVFITQLRAILRASIFGNFRIMFPMISGLEELLAAKSMVEEAKSQLKTEQLEFDRQIPLGIMIEVPSAAIVADILAPEADFFSIGTNDLCQYTLAVDRGNEKIKSLYEPLNPAVLRLISFVIDAARQNNIDVGMCGEFAADPKSTLLLIGMGLHEFSMSASSIPRVKNVILNHTEAKAREIWRDVKSMRSTDSIIKYLEALI
ncbi:MAG: phosphoenolpyruvate--protein phosphotransferase [Chryseolinea sp.]